MKKITMIILVPLLGLLLAGCGNRDDEPKVAGRWYTQSQVDLGKKVYSKNCITCHRENAQGTFGWKQALPNGKYPPPPLNGTAHAWHHPISVLKRVITDGGIPLGGMMPGFGDKLEEEEKLAVISYFQSFWKDEIYKEWLNRGGTN